MSGHPNAPAQDPNTLQDLLAWEPVATQYVLNSRMSYDWMQHANLRNVEQVYYQIALNRSRLKNDKNSLSSVLNLRLSVDILRALGVTDFDALRDLGEHYRTNSPRGLLDVPAKEVLRRHRAGYTAELYDLLARHDINWNIVEEWESEFPLHDLRLAVKANLNETEIRHILNTKELPDRDTLTMMAAFLPSAEPT